MEVGATLGSLAKSQAVFYALSFFRSDGVPPPAPARVPTGRYRDANRDGGSISLWV